MASPDESDLKTLAMLHIILGAIETFVSLVILLLTVETIHDMFSGGNGSWSLNLMPLIFFLAVLAVFALSTAAIFFAARSLKNRTNYSLIRQIALVECLFIPIGTVIGIFTISVLSRESVKGIFNSHSPTPPPLPNEVDEEDDWEY